MTRNSLCEGEGINRRILKLTVPTVLSNISVPLLALCDTAVAGHMGDEKYLAAIAVGSVMMSMTYWLFGFLRGGTSGLTATSFGADDHDGMGKCLLRSSMLGMVIGIALICIHTPVLHLLIRVMGASEGVSHLASVYFNICIWGAIPMMILTALSGWFVGMQSTGKAMKVNIGVSILNVIFTLTLVYGFHFGYRGIAFGTLLAQWIIIIPAIVMALKLCRSHGIVLNPDRKLFSDAEAWKKMFGVNSNLFFRSACLIAATMTMYSCSARMGDVATGAIAVINQLFLFFSFFMDGLAYTGEALVGRYNGARDLRMLSLSVRQLIKWSVCVTLLFMAVYASGLKEIAQLLTDSAPVVDSVMSCQLWVVAIPAAGAAAFLYDGFYIGLTKTRPMLIATLIGVALFVGLLFIFPRTQWLLWMSFTCYLALRSIILVCMFGKSCR